MRKHYGCVTTNAVLQTNAYKTYPFAINTIWLDLPDGTINILIKETDKNLALWLWKLITKDLQKELKEAEGSRRKEQNHTPLC